MKNKIQKYNNQTPYFILHKNKLLHNLVKLQELEKKANIHILHTLKSFNEPSITPMIAQNLSGMSIASPNELQMAQEAKAKYIHLYAPAFEKEQLKKMIEQVDSISFNSLSQWNAFKALHGSKGLRINPKLQLNIPSHCNPNLKSSRLGVDGLEFLASFRQNKEKFNDLEGLHFHALFQGSAKELIILLEHITTQFKEVLPKLKWLNLGGGHNFTTIDYEIDTLVKYLVNFQKLYPNLKLYFEPGESVTKGCGEFVATVLDIVNIEGKKLVILDTSIETHLLDVAIVKLKLKVKNTQDEVTPYGYQLTGNSCLQGDIMGDYYFTKPLHLGDKIVFEDMMAYSMVKMTKFNGMQKAKFYLA